MHINRRMRTIYFLTLHNVTITPGGLQIKKIIKIKSMVYSSQKSHTGQLGFSNELAEWQNDRIM